MAKKREARTAASTSWEAVAHWYNGWVGEEGSKHHRRLALPAVLDLLQVQPGEKILDLGAGQGVLAPLIAEAGAQYTGVEASPQLLRYARQQHGKAGNFLLGNACQLATVRGLHEGEFDAVVFLLSIQDMNPLEGALESAAWALRPGGRVVLLMTHPCFRIPRQSGWGWDENRRLQYRRVDHYLTPLAVPMKTYTTPEGGESATRSFHRPLEDYINGLSRCGLYLNQIKEIPGYRLNNRGLSSKAEERAQAEIPLFLGLRAVKVG